MVNVRSCYRSSSAAFQDARKCKCKFLEEVHTRQAGQAVLSIFFNGMSSFTGLEAPPQAKGILGHDFDLQDINLILSVLPGERLGVKKSRQVILLRGFIGSDLCLWSQSELLPEADASSPEHLRSETHRGFLARLPELALGYSRAIPWRQVSAQVSRAAMGWRYRPDGTGRQEELGGVARTSPPPAAYVGQRSPCWGRLTEKTERQEGDKDTNISRTSFKAPQTYLVYWIKSDNNSEPSKFSEAASGWARCYSSIIDDYTLLSCSLKQKF